MSELDEVSMNLGQLTANVENLNDNMTHLINWMKESHSESKAALAKHVETDERNFKELTDKVMVLDNFKNKVYTIASICAVICTGVVHLGVALVSKIKS